MRGLLPLSLVLALGATGGLAFLVVRRARDQEPAQAGGHAAVPVSPAREPAAAVLRPFQTTQTLAEDLRDALAGDPNAIDDECWRVSRAIRSKARWTLLNLVPREASPKVRALLTLAAGVHAQEDDLLLHFLKDREPVVRAAAALAAGYRAGGTSHRTLLGFVRVPLGRYEGRLEPYLETEEDETVRAALLAVLSLSR